MIIDATDLVAGRLASSIAKKVLLGETIDVINCENIVLTGNKKSILEKYKQRVDRGRPRKGPFIHRTPDRLFRRIVRGMLPYKQSKGSNAFKRVMCHIGIPQKFKDQKIETFNNIHVSKLESLKFIYLKDVVKFLR